MKSFLRLSLLLMLSTALITSCKKAVPKQTRHIPKDAVFVSMINTKSLQGKLVKEQTTIENILKSVTGSDTSVEKGRKEWEDLKAAGIDLDENFYVAVVQKGGGMSGQGTIVSSALGTLKDGAKLEAYIKKKDPEAEIRKEKEYTYTTVHGDKMVAWGGDLVIVMSYQKSFANAMEYDSATGSYNFKQPVNAENDMKTEMQTYFNLQESESVAAIPEFRDLMQDKADASMWINSSSSMENLPLPLPKLKELFANSFTAAKINFEDGKITFGSKSYYSKQLRDILKQYPGTDANLGLVENYPSDNIDGFAVAAFNPEVINGIVRYLEVGGMVDAYLTRMMGSNFTLQDALKAIKGDFAAIVSDFAMPVKDSAAPMMRNQIPDVQMIVNVPVGDNVQMNKLMDKLVEMQMMVKSGNQYRLGAAMQQTGWQVVVDDKNLLVASSEALLTQYRAKSKKAGINKDVMNDFKGKPGVAYLNIENILNAVPAGKDAEANNVIAKAKETFKDLKAYSESFNGKYMEAHAEIRFKNEKENSLSSLLHFAEAVSRNIKRNDMPPPGMDSMMDGQ